MGLLIILGVFWVIPMFVGHSIGKPKHRSGFLYAFFLGWLGVLIVVLLPPGKPLTLEELERLRPTASPAWYEKKRAELLAQESERD